MKACHPAISNGVAGLVRLSAMTVGSTVLVGSTTGAAVAHAVVFAGTSLWKLEVDTERLSLAVREVTEFVTGAEGWLPVAEGFFPALGHVLVGFAEADRAECLWLIGGDGSKGMGGRGRSPLIRVRMGGRGSCTVACAGNASPLSPRPTRRVNVGVLGGSCEDCHGLVLGSTRNTQTDGVVGRESTRWVGIPRNAEVSTDPKGNGSKKKARESVNRPAGEQFKRHGRA
jgi:hypothetical protein